MWESKYPTICFPSAISPPAFSYRSVSFLRCTLYTFCFWNKQRKKWSVRLIVNHERKYIGFYSDLKEAVEAKNRYIIDNNLTEYKIQEWKGE